MASLASLTKKMAVSPVKATVSTAKNVGSLIKGSVVNSIGTSSLRPSNILAATMDAAGVGGLMPALSRISDSVKQAFKEGKEEAMRGQTAKAAGVGRTAEVHDKGLEGLLLRLIDINIAISDMSNQIARNTAHTNELLTGVITGQKEQLLRDIEADREARGAKATSFTAAPGKEAKPASTGAGIGAGLMGLLGMIPGFGMLKSIFEGISGVIKTILEVAGIVFRGLLGIGRFLIRFAGPIGAVIAVLLALETQDWEKFFGRFTSAFKDFMEGKWLEGIVKIVIAIPELLVKGIGRIIARIAEFFGFEKFAKALDEIIDNFDLLDILKKTVNYITDFFIGIKDTVVNFFSDAKDKLVEWWNSFSIIDPIIDTFTYVKDTVVEFFGKVKDTVTEWINSAADLGKNIGEYIGNIANNVWEFFKSLPGKLVDAASNLIPDFIKEPFRKLFGGGGERSSSTTPTPSAAPTSAPTASTSRTSPALTQQDVAAVQGLTNVMSGNTSARSASTGALQAIDQLMNPSVPPVTAPGNQREQAFNQQSARQAIETGTTNAPVILNNTNMNVQGQGGNNQQSPSPRTSGAAPTAPVASHIDRALYGNAFGAGYA